MLLCFMWGYFLSLTSFNAQITLQWVVLNTLLWSQLTVRLRSSSQGLWAVFCLKYFGIWVTLKQKDISQLICWKGVWALACCIWMAYWRKILSFEQLKLVYCTMLLFSFVCRGHCQKSLIFNCWCHTVFINSFILRINIDLSILKC